MNSMFVPTDTFLEFGMVMYFVQAIRYALIAGGAYLIFYVWQKRKWMYKRIQQRFPERKKVLTEILFSMITFIIFSLMAVWLSWLHKQGHTFIYDDIAGYGWFYFIISIPMQLILHDTYFYWTHRLMHHKSMFNLFHKVHHLSNNPSPWAAFSFHPLEAIIEAGILPVIVFVMPVHPTSIFIFLLIMTMMNVIGHLGYEMYPEGFLKNKFLRLNNTSTHHNMHHRLVKCNYGLYFNVWDIVMKTNHIEYERNFAETASRKKNS